MSLKSRAHSMAENSGLDLSPSSSLYAPHPICSSGATTSLKQRKLGGREFSGVPSFLEVRASMAVLWLHHGAMGPLDLFCCDPSETSYSVSSPLSIQAGRSYISRPSRDRFGAVGSSAGTVTSWYAQSPKFPRPHKLSLGVHPCQ